MRRISKIIAAVCDGAKKAAAGRRSVAMCGLAALSLVVFSTAFFDTQLVTVTDGGTTKIVRTMSKDYVSLLSGMNIVLQENDELKTTTDGNITRLQVLRAFPVTLEADGKTYSEYFTKGTVSDLLMKCSVETSTDDILSSDRSEPLVSGMAVKVSRVVTKEESKQDIIPFNTIRAPSQNVREGKTVVKVKGENGTQLSLLRNTYVDGVLSKSEVLSTQVVKSPVTAQLVYGTGGDITTNRGALRYSHYIDMKATAYTYGNSGKWGNVTATGKAVKVGYVAVDPKVVPLGSRLYVSYPDGRFCYGYAVAQDTGGSIKGNRIDLFFDTRSECISFGVRTVRVYVLE